MKRPVLVLVMIIFLIAEYTLVNAATKVVYKEAGFGCEEFLIVFGQDSTTDKYTPPAWSYSLVSVFVPKLNQVSYNIHGYTRSDNWLWIYEAVLKDGTKLDFIKDEYRSEAKIFRGRVLCHEAYSLKFDRDWINNYTQKDLVFMIKGETGDRIITIQWYFIREWLDKIDEVVKTPQAFMHK